MDQLFDIDTSFARVDALLNPRNVVIAGATDKKGNWPQRVWRNLHRYGYPKPVFPYNPQRAEVWGTKCYQSFADLPEPPDHIVVLVPARFVCALLREAAQAGARSATVMTSGFGEAPDPASQALAAELRQVIAETGLAISGPNCLGNFNKSADLFTMPDDRPHRFQPGPVAVLGQSGGIVMAIKRTLEERGVNTSALITSGNEDGLTTADYIAYFTRQPHIKAIVCYLEAVHDTPSFLAALRAAKAAAKIVIAVKLGASTAGREAAAAHTGALAGAIEAFDAVAGEAGLLRMRNLDEVVEAVELVVGTRLPKGGRIGAITVSGGMRALLLDYAEGAGLVFNPLSPATHKRMSDLLSVGSIVGNPLDAGYAALSSQQSYLDCVQALLDDPEIDILILQEEIPREAGSKKEENMRAVDRLLQGATKPVIYMSMISYGLTDYSRELRAQLSGVSFMQEVDKSLRVISRIVQHAARLDVPEVLPPAPNQPGLALLRQALATPGPATLDEATSKSLLRAYGIATPQEDVAQTADEAAHIAARIGYPVVAKLVSADIPHKSDIGGVIIGIADEPALRAAFARIATIVAGLSGSPRLEGVLVAQMIKGGLELVLGANRDPEMGPVILFGAGGVELELNPDVALAAAPLDIPRAEALIDRTRVAKLLPAHRGRPARDRQALIQALIGLSHLVADAGDQITAIDINPFILLEQGGIALDALIILNKPTHP